MSRNPVFRQEELDVMKAQMMSQLEASLSNPGTQANRAFYPRVYPNPMARS